MPTIGILASWSLLPALTALFLNLTISLSGQWASISSLKLNHAMTREMVVKRPRSKPIALPPLIPGIERVHDMAILGVTISDQIGFGAHMDKICCKPRKSMFALRVLVTHGYHCERLFDIVRATILARLPYASSVWWGFATVGEHKRLNGITVF